jgi:two-component system, response regulator
MIDVDEVEILLVEDNPDDAEIALRALKRNKIANRIIHVRDGREALDFLYAEGDYSRRDSSVKPRLVLLDLKLPRINGLEVLKRIKGDPELKMVPVVVLTSSKEERDLVESYQLGANSFLVKPVDFDKFGESMREVGLYWLLLNQLPGD